MAITDETIKRLRATATAGDPDAARELGRLLCMLRSDSLEHLMNPDFLLTWPEERWLRAALRTRPDDRLAASLLAGRLVQQINYWKIDDDNANAHGEDERTLARRRDEAHALYTQTLKAVPDDPAARAGIAALNAWADDADMPEDPPFSYYELTLEMGGSGSYSHSETVVTSHPDEVRWACSWLLAPVVAEVKEPPFGVDLTLFIYSDGRCDSVIRLDEHLTADGMLGDVIEIPPLNGEPLPAGHPVGTRHYGYSCGWG
ncbi:hypothetical protein J2Z21_000397 [Streptomyces griseochromogenes]|uniref:Uncharacterized protein n=1 Tax=Streptomyces griseochromogenes TaxID=68214 RepID=A0A1B1B206_9ACTN|nr:hypothetical protein [Streptomyces griseochromogenes]ANP52853.1 hypothetical protein AVL59_27855 [Streptomyces griseochromogenes]MBP2047475.1 hypothetical protein [Streptomyces griseochromogenes]